MKWESLDLNKNWNWFIGQKVAESPDSYTSPDLNDSTLSTRSCILALLLEFEEPEDKLSGTDDECKETDEHKSELNIEKKKSPQEPEDCDSVLGCSVIRLWGEDLKQESENKWQLFSFSNDLYFE